MRVNYLADRELARKQLKGLENRKGQDYRIAFLAGLDQMASHLATSVPPLPSPEAPPGSNDWEGPLPQVPDPLAKAEPFNVPGQASIPSILMIEGDSDRAAGIALTHYSEGRWDLAFKAFDQIKPLPAVYWRLFHRATYLSRNWKETLNQGSQPHHGTGACRECFGAGFARALENENPIPELQRLLGQCKDAPADEWLILACIARRAVERGSDPKIEVPVAAPHETRGIIRVANLRWKSLAGGDEEELYRTAFQELEKPPSWMGKLSRIEGLLCFARRLKLRGAEIEAVVNEAIQLSNTLPNGTWNAPRVYRGEANLLLGRDDKAHTELPTDLALKVADLRAHLVWSDLYRRQTGWTEAINFAKRAADISPDNPVALYLRAAALLEEAQTLSNPGPKAVEASELLNSALEKLPGYVEAQLARALASFLIADWAAMSPAHATSCRLSAERDLKQVLAKVPNLAPALTLQKHLGDLLRRGGSK